MGIFHSLKVLGKVARIQKGGTEFLSVADVASVTLNMSQAQRNLPADQFRKLAALYKGFAMSTETSRMDRDRFDEITVEIYRTFDEIAPLEAYTDTSDIFTIYNIAMARNDKEKIAMYGKKILELMLK